MAMLSTTFLFALDNTIVADIQPAIINEYGDVALLPWIGTGFALGTMAILSWGKAYGIFSLKALYTFNILLFEVGSVLCGAAPNMPTLIVGRVIAGIGGSGMYSGTMTYVSVLTTMEERPAYMAGSTAIWGGTVLGPLVGGAFATSSATWRWGFYINLVVGAVFAPAYLLLFLSIDPQPGKTYKDRLYPAHFLGKPTLVNLQLQVFLSSGIILAMTYYIPLFFQFVRGDGPLDVGIRLLPLIVFMVAVSMVNGVLMGKLSYISPWYIVGSGLELVGALMYTIGQDTPNANIYGYTILIGAGAGCYIVAGFPIAQSLVSATDIANAVGAMTIAQDLGMLVAGTSSAAYKSLSAADKAVVGPQITSAMGNVWLIYLIAAALSFLFSLPLGVGDASKPAFPMAVPH
ncbi:Major facilitator superfamily (MFS) profile domain-containing protein [Madurella fahalii]|uniref:Major facilitator superfamily (MFS) profile domain-containing protein n=1 Tax=Madurella fahalii TaxID=1157608 RepID=A0ABQ0GEW3_9PEZI